ncbi:hypothetical protein FGLOB1_5807 [Fusarium globosum]|uniref:Uncharacterized protein n=1 Tax=Fusarium globosum TaxID=78864 RepID=A0A8H5YDN8_9HYPO|nr:hypothetical protein FGLOB1_5807 [Fusarium globosum]
MMSDLLSHPIDLLDDEMLNAATENQSEIVILGTECVRAPASESSGTAHSDRVVRDLSQEEDRERPRGKLGAPETKHEILDGEKAISEMNQDDDPSISNIEEKPLVRKIDLQYIPKLVGQEFPWLNRAFYLGYLGATYPVSVLLVKLPIAKLLASSILIWAVVFGCHGASENFAALCALRVGLILAFRQYLSWENSKRDKTQGLCIDAESPQRDSMPAIVMEATDDTDFENMNFRYGIRMTSTVLRVEAVQKHLATKLTAQVEYVDETDRVSQDYERQEQEDICLAQDLSIDPDLAEPGQPPSEAAHVSPPSQIVHTISPMPDISHHDFANSPASSQLTRHLRYSSELVRSPDSPYSRPPMQFTTREAELIKNFTENMALWADATDVHRHFELEVPRRSLYFPVLRYAVFAFSSRHLNRDKADTSTEALEYYNSCLSVLIEAVDKASGHIDEETLAAIAILRQYEEMDAEDMEMHLTGTSRIVNSMSEFDFNGGLGEAAAWLCLRQDIYVSLTRLRPLRSNLENYLQSDIFRRTDDAAYANKMVYLLARSLGSIYPSDSSISNESLENIRLEVDGWLDSKPAAFNPILESARNKDQGNSLPIIWVLSPFHSVGLQYYHIAKIVLAMSFPIATDSVFEQIRESKKVERTIRSHLLQVIALASSHAKAENALFTARHSLSIWGSVFTDRMDQDMVLDFLRHIQQKTGWQIESLSSSLQQQWTQDLNED